LIPLLRYRVPDGGECLEAPDRRAPPLRVPDFVDDLSTTRAIIAGILIAALFWTAISLFFTLSRG